MGKYFFKNWKNVSTSISKQSFMPIFPILSKLQSIQTIFVKYCFATTDIILLKYSKTCEKDSVFDKVPAQQLESHFRRFSYSLNREFFPFKIEFHFMWDSFSEVLLYYSLPYSLNEVFPSFQHIFIFCVIHFNFYCPVAVVHAGTGSHGNRVFLQFPVGRTQDVFLGEPQLHPRHFVLMICRCVRDDAVVVLDVVVSYE